MVILVPLTFFLSLEYGAIGGAMAWLVLHVLYVLLGTWLTHRQLLKGIGMTWLLHDVAIPLCLSMIVGFIGYYFIQDADYSSGMKLMYGAFLALTAALLSLAFMPKPFRIILLNKINF